HPLGARTVESATGPAEVGRSIVLNARENAAQRRQLGMLTSHADRPLHGTARVGPGEHLRTLAFTTMILSSPQLRRFVRRTLVEATGTKALARPQLATAFNTLCERLRERLRPLFGASAVTALF